MPVSAGTRLGPYEILSSIGAGGMGEVYRARDTRLDRTVAVKVLPTHLSESPQARERFDREAKAISSLSHPHICPLYDVGHQDGIDFLVMEYLEGETLAHRLKKGPLPPDQALQFAIQITDALDTAHRHGVIHRDLKPGNIMLTKAGAKLLDFGLAKVQASEAAAGMTQLPTQTTPLTAEGTILGTMQYMAPEQLEGHEADARTDIFALGAVIYEMATGRRAFEGKSRASLIAAILEREPPPVSTLQPLTAPALDHVVRTCMAKDPDARWQTAHDVLVDLKWVADAGTQAATASSAKSSVRERISWALVAGLLVVLAVFVGFFFTRHTEEPHTTRLELLLPDKMRMDPGIDFPVISPDGQRVVLPGIAADGVRHLWLRSLDSLSYQLLPGTDEAYFPFWSPDGAWIAFFTNTKLKRISVAAGLAETICNARFANLGGTWNRDGIIVFSEYFGRALLRVPASGGEPKPAIAAEKGTSLLFPQFLPEGRRFLYVLDKGAKHDLYLGSMDNKDAQVLIPGGSPATYVPPGFLVYGRQETLFARRFDARTLRFTGDAVPIAEHVGRLTTESTEFLASVSQTGALVYSPSSGPIQLAWHNREGSRQTAVGEPGLYEELDLSPDEKKLAVIRHNPGENPELWILDIPTGVFSRLESNPSTDPHWSPDSRELLFSSVEQGQGKNEVYRKTLGARDRTLVFQSDQDTWVAQWLPDGTALVQTPTVYQVPLSTGGKPQILLKQEDYLGFPKVSPNGHWAAYYASESGRDEVYIAAFPSFNEKRQVSTGGGCQPVWRRDGKELLYLSLDGKMMSVAVKGDTSIETTVPKALFRMSIPVDSNTIQYAVSKDGTRFLYGDPVGEESRLVTVVLNWQAGLKR